MTNRYRVTNVHGESRTVSHIVDTHAPDDHQPAIIGSTTNDVPAARRWADVLNTLHERHVETYLDAVLTHLDTPPGATTPTCPTCGEPGTHNHADDAIEPRGADGLTDLDRAHRARVRVRTFSGDSVYSIIVITVGITAALCFAAQVMTGPRVRPLTLSPTGGTITVPAGQPITLTPHARTRYILTEIGTDGDAAPVLASWTISIQEGR